MEFISLSESINYRPKSSDELMSRLTVRSPRRRPDTFSRRIVGWAMAEQMKAELVTDALQKALARRRPEAGLIHHSDSGSQYVSLAFGQKARDAGVAVSMGLKGLPR